VSLTAATSLLLALAGCQVQTIGGVEAGGSSAGEAPSAVTIAGSAMPADPYGYLTQLAAIHVEPTSLYVFIGNFAEQCASPFPPGCDGPAAMTSDVVGNWQMLLGIPAALQQPGVLSLPQAGVDAVVGMGGTGPSEASTCGADPTGLVGDVEIVSVDDTGVTLHFEGVEPQAWIGSAPSAIDAVYTAPRCP